jgi:plasmid stabilization system protein ParE
VRRALLHTFPYAVYFHLSEETVLVLAVLHLRRNPKVWRGRLR